MADGEAVSADAAILRVCAALADPDAPSRDYAPGVAGAALDACDLAATDERPVAEAFADALATLNRRAEELGLCDDEAVDVPRGVG